jgi:hypothetical protein
MRERAYRVRTGRRLQDGQHPAHRVPDEDRRLSRDLADELIEQGQVRVDRRRAAEPLRQAEAAQVQRQRPASGAKLRADESPVQVRAAEAVDEDDRRTCCLGPELEPVHRPGQRGDVAARTPRGS